MVYTATKIILDPEITSLRFLEDGMAEFAIEKHKGYLTPGGYLVLEFLDHQGLFPDQRSVNLLISLHILRYESISMTRSSGNYRFQNDLLPT